MWYCAFMAVGTMGRGIGKQTASESVAASAVIKLCFEGRRPVYAVLYRYERTV